LIQKPTFLGFVDIVRSHEDLHTECYKCYCRFISVWNEFKRPRVKYASSTRL
jgi:hypothetical protein